VQLVSAPLSTSAGSLLRPPGWSLCRLCPALRSYVPSRPVRPLRGPVAVARACRRDFAALGALPLCPASPGIHPEVFPAR